MTRLEEIRKEIEDLTDRIINFNIGGHVVDHAIAWSCSGCFDQNTFVGLCEKLKRLLKELKGLE